MRLGVIDVGSNTVHLLVVDAHPGAQPLPASKHKIDLRLSEHVTDDGHIADAGRDRLGEFVQQCLDVAEDQGVEDLSGFVTSAIREAPNGEDVLHAVEQRTGVVLTVLSGEEEARLTFLAARRWFGWSAGTLLVADIGGGSLELAQGMDEEPDVALSLPLGAGRVTRELLRDDPPSRDDLREARKLVRATIAAELRPLAKAGAPDHAVGTSKTMRSLARICGAAPSAEGMYAERTLDRETLADKLPEIAGMTAKERAGLPGVSAARAQQVLAGGVVAEATMDLLGIDRLEICPWALREGVILRHLDRMSCAVAPRTRARTHRSRPVEVPHAQVGLSTASVYPENCATAFELAARLGYDGVEVMVWTDPVTREAGALSALARLHGIRVLSVHAPTLLVTQRVWGTDPWDKVDRSVELALELGADTVVLHPPFRWQRDYARDFVDGVALRENDTGIRLAVENMYPWRGPRSREIEAYLPHWDPVPQPYDHVTIDLSHTATAGSDALAMVRALGPRLTHLHLADGVGSPRDEHLVPGRGTQPCGEVLETLATQGYAGHVVVEVATRRAGAAQRELDIAESLAFARLHLAAPVAVPGD